MWRNDLFIPWYYKLNAQNVNTIFENSSMRYTETLWSIENFIALSCHLITQDTLVLIAYKKMHNFFCQKPAYFAKHLRRASLKFICSGRSSESSRLQQSGRQWRSSLPPCRRGTGSCSGTCTAVITSCSRLMPTEILSGESTFFWRTSSVFLQKSACFDTQLERRVKAVKKQLMRDKQNLWVELQLRRLRSAQQAEAYN